MEKTDGTWKLFVMYFAIILLILLSNSAFGQITATHFNAGWNQSNDVSWFMGLKDCGTKGLTDISKDTEAAKKYKIAVVPTIIIFKDNNDWNEKSIIGALAFIIMVLVMILDLLTGWLGRDLAINEFVYDSFVWVVLGCFGIAGIEKFAKK